LAIKVDKIIYRFHVSLQAKWFNE